MVKKKPKWKPKKFVIGGTIDMKTGKVTPSKVIQAKTPEEEKEWERGFAERWVDSMKILWGDKFDWFVRNVKYFIDKYGEEEFSRRWNKAMKELERKEPVPSNFMDKKELKEIFELMFEKLKSISIDDNFIDDISKRRKTTFDKNRPDSFFYQQLVGTIHVSGYRVSILRNRWDDIKKAFSNYDVYKVSRYTDRDFKKMMQNPKLIKNERKLRACIENAKIMKDISEKYGSFGEYLERNKTNLKKLKEDLIKKFHYLGNVLVLEYLKEIGIDSIKPDVHVVRVMYRLCLIDSEKMSPENIDKVIEVASKMSQSTKEKLSVIDAIFWMYGGSGDNHVKKAMCSKNKPLCRECPLMEYCIFHSKKNSE